MSKMKFVAGDQDAPSTFVQRLFHKMEEGLATNQGGKMFFCAGEQTPEEVLAGQQREIRLAATAQSSGEQAEKIYAQMQALDGLYANLQRLNAQTRDDFQDLRQELEIVTFAMGRIAQSLSRPRRPLPPQNLPPFRDFCQGLQQTIKYVSGILWDLRVLMRSNIGQSTQIQLFIIYTTLSAQRQQLAEIKADCK